MIRFALLLLAASLSFAADPFIGTWKPDTAKWKLSAGAPERRKSELLTFESGGKDGYRVIIQNKASSVPPQERFFDGKEHKTEDGFTEKFERIDERHLKITASSSKGNAVFEYAVSANGRTLTVTRKDVGLTSGRILDELLVYEKQ